MSSKFRVRCSLVAALYSVKINAVMYGIGIGYLPWTRRSSVGRGAGLVIERLQNLGSTSDAVARLCVPGKDT